MRLALGVEYDGTNYMGWQRQRHGNTVQGELEAALSRVADESVNVVAAGRTDAGVHATGQVIHFDTSAIRGGRGWLLGSNAQLPPDISVTWIREVGGEFHARYSARRRCYTYLIINRPARSALCARRALLVREALDVAAMQRGARHVLGEHDFTSLRAAGCQSRTPTREIFSVELDRSHDWITVVVSANAFLQHMVRNLVGLLVTIGRGELAPEAVRSILAARDRAAAPFAAAPDGLYLTAVSYPPAFGVPSSPSLRTLPLPAIFSHASGASLV